MKKKLTDKNGRQFFNGWYLLYVNDLWYKVTSDTRPMHQRGQSTMAYRMELSRDENGWLQASHDGSDDQVISTYFTEAYSPDEFETFMLLQSVPSYQFPDYDPADEAETYEDNDN
jgi:hypothetical protein